MVVSGPAHHRDVPRKLRLFGQDRHPLCHLRRQRHGRRGRFEIRLLEGDKVAPRQAPEQPREHGKRAEMGREPGAVNKKSGPSEPLSRLRKNKKRAKRRVTSVFAVRKPWCTSNSPACALLNVPRIPKPAHLRRANILRSKILAEVGFISIEHFNYPWVKPPAARETKKRAEWRVTSVFALRKPWCTSNSFVCALLNVLRIPKPAHLRRASILRSKILAEVGFTSTEHLNYPWGERMK